MDIKRYRKKPIVIEAVQLSLDNIDDVAKWCGGLTMVSRIFDNPIPLIRIYTLEGEMNAFVGDWIIGGVNGEYYPCRDDVFWKTYEEEQDG